MTDTIATAAASTASGVDPAAGRRVYVRGVRSALGWCVADLLRATPDLQVVVASGDAPATPGHFDTVVDVGLADHDLLGRRGESVTAECARGVSVSPLDSHL